MKSVAYADHRSDSISWLKSVDFKPQEFAVADKTTLQCTVTSTEDTWSNSASPGYLNLTQGNGEVRAAAAARGFRIPRFIGRADGLTNGTTNSASLFTEEGLILARGSRPVLRTDMGNFLDQCFVTQSCPASTSDQDLLNNNSAMIFFGRLRP